MPSTKKYKKRKPYGLTKNRRVRRYRGGSTLNDTNADVENIKNRMR
jgi:hypothetical protein